MLIYQYYRLKLEAYNDIQCTLYYCHCYNWKFITIATLRSSYTIVLRFTNRNPTFGANTLIPIDKHRSEKKGLATDDQQESGEDAEMSDCFIKVVCVVVR